jgi:hypothetical protein
MLLDRPLVVIDCPELLKHARVAPDKVQALRDAAIVVKSHSAAITQAVRRALADPSAASAERHATAARMFYRPGTATARAVQCIYDALDLRAIAAEAGPSVISPSQALSSSRTAHHV